MNKEQLISAFRNLKESGKDFPIGSQVFYLEQRTSGVSFTEFFINAVRVIDYDYGKDLRYTVIKTADEKDTANYKFALFPALPSQLFATVDDAIKALESLQGKSIVPIKSYSDVIEMTVGDKTYKKDDIIFVIHGLGGSQGYIKGYDSLTIIRHKIIGFTIKKGVNYVMTEFYDGTSNAQNIGVDFDTIDLGKTAVFSTFQDAYKATGFYSVVAEPKIGEEIQGYDNKKLTIESFSYHSAFGFRYYCSDSEHNIICITENPKLAHY